MKSIISSKSCKIKLPPYTFDVSIYKNGFLRNADSLASSAARMHFHTQYEMFFTSGSPIIISFDEKETSFCNSAVCVPPYVAHTVKHMENTYNFRFEITHSGEKQGEYSHFSELFDGRMRAFSINGTMIARLEDIERALKTPTAHQDEKISSFIKLLLIELLESNTSEERYADKDTVDDYFMIIEDFIHNRFKEPITLSDVASSLHLSEKQTARIIKKRYGHSLPDLIRKKRLGIAAELLKSTDLTIGNIARETYGEAENYFYVNFKKEFGTTPLKYRKMNK